MKTAPKKPTSKTVAKKQTQTFAKKAIKRDAMTGRIKITDLAGIYNEKESDELTAYASAMRGYPLKTK